MLEQKYIMPSSLHTVSASALAMLLNSILVVLYIKQGDVNATLATTSLSFSANVMRAQTFKRHIPNVERKNTTLAMSSSRDLIKLFLHFKISQESDSMAFGNKF